jgi:hypothetical protein
LSLYDELPPKLGPGTRCSVGEFLKRSDRRPDWEEMLANEAVDGRRIWRLMREKYAFDSMYQSVRRHRAKECACARPE